MFNVVRQAAVPPSLAHKRSYREADVIEALQEAFFHKCYLCETKEPTSLNVEHFIAHQGDEDKKFAWTNLFYACARCNGIKHTRYDDILDCTDSNVNVFTAIKHLPPYTPNQERLQISATNDDARTVRTAELLNEIFNSNNTVNQRVTSVYLRTKVFEKYSRLLDHIIAYHSHESSQAKKDDALGILQTLMSRKQEYSAFLRWVIVEDAVLNPLLQPYFD